MYVNPIFRTNSYFMPTAMKQKTEDKHTENDLVQTQFQWRLKWQKAGKEELSQCQEIKLFFK